MLFRPLFGRSCRSFSIQYNTIMLNALIILSAIRLDYVGSRAATAE